MLALLGRRRLILLLLLVASPVQAAISVTTMNIEFYGLKADEARDPTINRYLDDNDLRSDVMVFQEIVDVERLQANIAGLSYTCVSYDSTSDKHQHVVVCVKRTFRFDKAEDDDDFILENVAMGNERYRPAVHGILTDVATGKKLAHVVAVHLKAMPEDGQKRIEQTWLIHDYLALDRADSLPAIVVGDTNIYPDDIDAVNAILSDETLGLTSLDSPGKFTFRDPQHGQKFDRFWVGRGLSLAGEARVPGPCNLVAGSANTAKIKAYNRDVSDHCAVVVNLVPSP